MQSSIFLILVFVFLVFAGGDCKAQTLSEFFDTAKNNTALLKTQKLNVEIARQRKSQANSTILPSLSVESNNVWRDQADVGPFGEGYQHSALLNLTQPLFQGGAEYYALGIAKNLPAIAKLEKQQEERRVFSLVAQSFYQALRLQKERDLFLEQEKTLNDLAKTLKKRSRIGRSKVTDLLAAQSQLARVRAERSQTERLLTASKRELQNLTAVNPVRELIDDIPVSSLQVKPHWENQLLKNPRFLANKLVLQNAEREVKAAKGTYLPTVDANANYYLDRAGILRDSEWDVTVNARWNLYNGGNDSSEVKVQRLEAAQLQMQLDDIKRTLKNDFASLKRELDIHQTLLKQMNEAVRLAKKNYREHVKEARRGLVNELDALRVLDQYLQIQRNQTQQIFEAKLTHAQLQALSGDLP
ncbi:MAG: TolC family protein [Pseudomonadota bacterium]